MRSEVSRPGLKGEDEKEIQEDEKVENTDTENKLLGIRGQKKWVGDNSGMWAMRYKPLLIK